ncbi:hypothetical protein B0T13DRAFT_462485 [Neurospora crassa]|nr:hypothetical protein B0T13DRAFT_462485 [Neurospora crassa]
MDFMLCAPLSAAATLLPSGVVAALGDFHVAASMSPPPSHLTDLSGALYRVETLRVPPGAAWILSTPGCPWHLLPLLLVASAPPSASMEQGHQGECEANLGVLQ